jgi:electron transport complex protein RnfB
MNLVPVAVLGGMGIAFGIFLGFVSKKLAVKKDEREEQVLGVLPGYNCGACGFAGCAAYAAAIAKGEEINKCKPGGNDVIGKVAKIMGKEASSVDEKVAVVRCGGGEKEAKNKSEYLGLETCRAATLVNGGPKACCFGCLGYGDCEQVCPVKAITIGDDDLPDVDYKKCTGCGSCVTNCPKGVMMLVSKNKFVYVACNSTEPGKKVTQVCKVGCIACKICERECKFDAIHVVNNLAVIDYSKCTNCTMCVQKCPRKIIKDRRKE